MELCCSELPPCCPVYPSDPLPFLLSDSCLSRLLTRLPAPKHLSYLASERFLPICSGFFLPNFPPFSLILTLSHFLVRQDKLSEEVRKQFDGPEENGSPPSTQTELPPSADPDASQAEEDKDKTKPLLDRLKTLEVHHLYCFCFSLPTFFVLRSSSSCTLPSHPWLSFVVQPVCQLSESLLGCV